MEIFQKNWWEIFLNFPGSQKLMFASGKMAEFVIK